MHTICNTPYTAVLICFISLCAPDSWAEPRTFTSPDGRTLQADILSATPDTVTLKMSTGQTLVTPIARFSQEDQAHINAWRKQNPAPIKYNFAASFTKEKKNTSKSSTGAEVITTDTWVCNMKIANRSGQTLEGVTVEYEVFYNILNRGQPVLQKLTGKAEAGTIKHLQEVVVPTGEIKLTTTLLDGSYYYADSTRARKKESLEGMIITISHEGKKVFTWASSGVPKGANTTAPGTTGSLFGN